MEITSPLTHEPRLAAPTASVVPYLRRVYGLLTGGVGFAIAGALFVLYTGSVTAMSGSGLRVPPMVAFGMKHWIVMAMVAFGAQAARRAGVGRRRAPPSPRRDEPALVRVLSSSRRR